MRGSGSMSAVFVVHVVMKGLVITFALRQGPERVSRSQPRRGLTSKSLEKCDVV